MCVVREKEKRKYRYKIVDGESGRRSNVVVVVVIFFFNDTATTEIYTEWIVGSVRCI